MFIPKRAVCLSSLIAHYERWFLMRATLLPTFASEPRQHLTRRCSEPPLCLVLRACEHRFSLARSLILCLVRPLPMRLVIFDIDGTLTATMKADEECFARALAEVC